MNIPASSAALKRYLRHGTFPQLVTLEAVMRLGSASQAAETLVHGTVDACPAICTGSAMRSR